MDDTMAVPVFICAYNEPVIVGRHRVNTYGYLAAAEKAQL